MNVFLDIFKQRNQELLLKYAVVTVFVFFFFSVNSSGFYCQTLLSALVFMIWGKVNSLFCFVLFCLSYCGCYAVFCFAQPLFMIEAIFSDHITVTYECGDQQHNTQMVRIWPFYQEHKKYFIKHM